MPTIVINESFQKLNGYDYKVKEGSISSRERATVVDITFASGDEYPTNGITLDFSQIKNFKYVYYCKILTKSFANKGNYFPSTGNISSTGKMKFYDFSGVELSNNNTALESQTMTVEIRGN